MTPLWKNNSGMGIGSNGNFISYSNKENNYF